MVLGLEEVVLELEQGLVLELYCTLNCQYQDHILLLALVMVLGLEEVVLEL
jgi:hypothetical protein